ncbi:MAG: DUF5054 domain-containing protein [Bacillota bacterium]
MKEMEPCKLQGIDTDGIPQDLSVEQVHVIYKSHIDIGFTESEHKLVHDIINWQLPVAIGQANQMRENGMEEYFAWTLPSWFIWHALETKTGEAKKELEEAILKGDIVWTATPFTPHTEFMSASLFEHAIKISKRLDKRFGKNTIAAKFTDVPGNTVGMLEILAQNDIKLIHVGVNHMSAVPDVPSEFVWRDKKGNEVIVMYCRGYGNTMKFPGTNVVLAQAFIGDNMELQSQEDVIAVINGLKAGYPNAEVKATSYSDFAREVLCSKEHLPVMEGEIGDSWIHGCGTDPLKTAQYRALSRLRDKWLMSGELDVDSKECIDFSNNLMLIAEHTWGVSHLPHLNDLVNWDNPSFHSVRHRGNYKTLEASWQEQRDYIEYAILSLNDEEKIKEAQAVIDEASPKKPVHAGMEPFEPDEELESGVFKIKICKDTGAIKSLVNTAKDIQLAGENNLIGKFGYQTFDLDDFKRFIKGYCFSDSDFLLTEFGKKGIENTYAQSKWWEVKPTAFYKRQEADGLKLVIVLEMPKETVEKYGGAKEVYQEIFIPNDKENISFKISWFDKTATRLPEAFWYSFNPIVEQSEKWVMDKMGYDVSPLEVIKGGGNKLHAIQKGVSYHGKDVGISIDTIDAALVAPGEPSLTVFDGVAPDLNKGMHFNLFNNIWNTNFVAWYEDDASFRFEL